MRGEGLWDRGDERGEKVGKVWGMSVDEVGEVGNEGRRAREIVVGELGKVWRNVRW